jgi:hypothetical protein
MDFINVAISEVLTKTDKAIRVVIGDREIWMPISVIDGYEPAVGEGTTIPVAKWFVEREDLPEADDEDGDVITAFRFRRSRDIGIRRVRHNVRLRRVTFDGRRQERCAV